MRMLVEAACMSLGMMMRDHPALRAPGKSSVCREEVDGRVSGTYLPEPVRPWRRRQQQSWYAAGPLLDRNATVGRSYAK